MDRRHAHALVDFADFGSRGFAPPPEHGSMTPSGAIVSLVLTGGWETARLFQSWRPSLTMFAETSGKNSMFISAMSDRAMEEYRSRLEEYERIFGFKPHALEISVGAGMIAV
ncbi:MAG TPA: hypothetical protein PLW80_06520 [Spirochaetales bacterium]|nr:hypothetical protein [Spirochaetales bacterium]